MIFFGLRQAVEDCPHILRVLDTKKQIVGTHRSRKHNLQHPYAPKFAVFHEKKRPQMALFWSHIDFFGFVQAVEGSPPYFEDAGCKIASCMHARTTKAQSTASVCTKICYFSWKNCQKWPFLGQKLSILASDRQLQSPPPPILRVLDAKKHAVWTHRLPKHNLQHSYATKSAIFQQNRRKIAIFFIKNCLFFLA